MNNSQKSQLQREGGITKPQQTIGEQIKEQISTFERGFNHRIKDIENKIGGYYSQFKTLEDKVDHLIQLHENKGLENTHLDILIFFQELNIYLENPIVDKNFAHAVQEYLKTVLAKYGYCFVDYDEEHKDVYEVEFDSSIKGGSEMIRRAIIESESGKLVSKGKIYIFKEQ